MGRPIVVVGVSGCDCLPAMLNYLVVARKTEILAVSLDVPYFSFVRLPVGTPGNALAVAVDSSRGEEGLPHVPLTATLRVKNCG